MTYKSNTDAVLSRIRNLLGKDKMDALYLEMAQNMYASNLRRVHVDGKNVAGASIGNYSKNPIYINPAKVGSRKFALKGKTGKTTFGNGKAHKTGFFKGYGAFKKQIGFTSKVNMQVTGRLKADWVLLKSSTGYVIGFRSKYGKEISERQESHFYAPIWGVSQADKKTNAQIIKRYLNAKSRSRCY